MQVKNKTNSKPIEAEDIIFDDSEDNKNTFYKHFFQKVPINANFMDEFNAILVTDINQLIELKEKLKGKTIAFDTETDGLTYFKNKIVGFSLAVSLNEAYYIPIRHQIKTPYIREELKHDKEGNVMVSSRTGRPFMKKVVDYHTRDHELNLPSTDALNILYDILLDANLVIAHNAEFDLLMLKGEGYDISQIKFFDTMVLLYNADTNSVGDKQSSVKVDFGVGLKKAAEHFLGRKPPTFKETMGKEKNFAFIDPKLCLVYAALDASNTYGIFQYLYPKLKKECERILLLDNSLVKSFVNYYSVNKIHIDKDIMIRYRDSLLRDIDATQGEVSEFFQYMFDVDPDFNIGSTKQIAEAFRLKGIDTGKRTKTGAMCVDKDALSKLDHPIGKKLIKLSSLKKQLNSYVNKMSEVDSCYIRYKLFGTASGRLASGNNTKSVLDKNHFFIDLNIQNLTKPKPTKYLVEHTDVKGKENILGYKFTEVSEEFIQNNSDLKFVEGFKQDINVRNAITVPDKDYYLFVSIDFSSQELALVAVLSQEPNLLDPLINGADPHANMAKKLFGADKYNKEYRRIAKNVNFGVLYGGGAHTLARTMSTPDLIYSVEEAQEILDMYWGINKTLKGWINMEHKKTRGENKGVTYDIFGRPRRLSFFLSYTEDMVPHAVAAKMAKEYDTPVDRVKWKLAKKIESYGERSVVSHKVQGSCSSIMRNILVKCYTHIFRNPDNKDEIGFVSSVHDEMNFYIRKDVIYKWLPVLQQLMEFRLTGWPLTLTVSFELGTSLGNTFPFKWSDDTKTIMVPKYL